MGLFGYEFATLNDEEKHARRVLLEYYPMIAQWSVLVVIVFFQISYLVSWVIRRGLNDERPRSPSFNKRGNKWPWLRSGLQTSTKLRWWIRKDVVKGWGTRAEWIGGGLWTVWLIYLCFAQTGNDYLHLTKRFGIIGASQLPLHYLLAMRSPYSPIQHLTRTSHEDLKAAHQVLGRIVFLLFTLHTLFYTNFFILSGFLAKRIKDKDVIFGLISFALFAAISTTALSRLRKWNYRVFYTTHIAIANLLIIPLYIHVTHIRPYVYQILIINALHLLLRSRSLTLHPGTITLIPRTNLICVRISLPPSSSALNWKPGQHIYLSRPSGGTSSTKSLSDHLLLHTRTNPFTIASLPLQDKQLLLIARTRNGTTKHLAQLARSLSSSGNDDEVSNISLALEGPYGASNRLPDFANFDSVLLVAGGVGATFIMPLFRSVREAVEQPHTSLRCVWAVRKMDEVEWAFPVEGPASETGDGEDDAPSSSSNNNVEIYITRPSGANLQVNEHSGEEIELAEDVELLSAEELMDKPRKGISLKMGRPHISGIVDEVFSKGGRIAVVSCGPKGLTETLSQSVEQWVKKGADVFWYEEGFGW